MRGVSGPVHVDVIQEPLEQEPMSKPEPVVEQTTPRPAIPHAGDRDVQAGLIQSRLQTLVAPSPKDSVLVVGMGPAGLVTAIEAARAGKHVTIVDNRSDFTRIQRVMLDYSTLEYMKELTDPANKPTEAQKTILRKLNQTLDHAIELKDVQKFFDDAIRHNPNLKSLISIQQGDVKSTVAQAARFGHVVDATGGRGIDGIESTQPEKRVALQYQPRQEAQGAVTLSTLTDAKKRVRELANEDLPALREAGWDKPYLPEFYLFSNPEATKHYFAGEIPSSIMAIKNPDEQRSATQKWGEKILRLVYNLPADFPVGEYAAGKTSERALAKKKLAVTAFPMKLSYVPQASETLPDGRVLVRVGDAAKNPNFYFGHGVNDAVQDAMAFGQALRQKSGFDHAQFHEHHERERSILESRMNTQKAGWTYDYKRQLDDVQTKLEELRADSDDELINTRVKPALDYAKSLAATLGDRQLVKELESVDVNDVDKTVHQLVSVAVRLQQNPKLETDFSLREKVMSFFKDILALVSERKRRLNEIRELAQDPELLAYIADKKTQAELEFQEEGLKKLVG